MRYRTYCLMLMFCADLVRAQTPNGLSDIFRVGNGVTPPKLLHKIEPEFSEEARANRIQGTVVLQVVVSQQGRATDISVISPLGFGLEEQAQAAIEKWEFVPGKKMVSR